MWRRPPWRKKIILVLLLNWQLVYGNLDPCSTTPCGANGSCTKITDTTYKCTCTNSYTGTNCETAPLYDQNDSNWLIEFQRASVIVPSNCACMNGGTCVTQNGQTICQCVNNFWSGVEHTTNFCAQMDRCTYTYNLANDIGLVNKLPIHEGNKASCLGWVTSETEITSLTSAGTLNTGNYRTKAGKDGCTPGADGAYQCVCNGFYSGQNCEIDEPCKRNLQAGSISPCHHGTTDPATSGSTCQSTGTGDTDFTCTCTNFYFGNNCINPPPCSSNSGLGSCINNSDSCTNLDTPGDYDCTCNGETANGLSQFSGKNCETDKCAVCDATGTLKCDLSSKFTCYCKCDDEAKRDANGVCQGAGYTGLTCSQRNEDPVDFCNPNPCNTGTCANKSDGSGSTCTCPANTFGNFCAPSPCDSNPCVAGNTVKCVASSATDYTCQCKTHYSGNHCQNTPCQNNPCGINATCQDDDTNVDTGRVCTCLNDYYGLNCDIPCGGTVKPDPCGVNKQTCTTLNANGEYKCVCKTDWGGMVTKVINGVNEAQDCDLHLSSTCRTDADCQKASVNAGSCVFTAGKGACVCQNDYYGTVCENQHPCDAGDPCNALKNQGTCNKQANGQYTCTCAENYGPPETCAALQKDPPNHCDPSPCKNGSSCTSDNVGYTCTCVNNFTGTDCGIPPDPCLNFGCQNGSTCQVTNGAAECVCLNQFYSGSKCETKPPCENPLIKSDCLNNSQCKNLSTTTFQCVCVNDFYGQFCEKQPPCTANPCNTDNTASCTNHSPAEGNRKCICKTGFTGADCSIQEVTPCDPNPCNGGICSVVNNNAQCDCSQIAGLRPSGDFCQIPHPCNDVNTCGGAIHTCQAKVADPVDYECVCSQFYTGKNCENLPPCTALDPCQNNSQCTNNPGAANGLGYTCDCQVVAGNSFHGNQCEIPYPCNTGLNPCVAGQCQSLDNQGEILTTAKCVCPNQFYYGNFCENTPPCDDPNACNSRGVCTNGLNGAFTCDCQDPYFGDQCQFQPPCTKAENANICNGNGACQNVPGSLTETTCQCNQFYYGDRCQFEPVCSTTLNGCLNNGQCVNLDVPQTETDAENRYRCECDLTVSKHFGTKCEKLPCDNNACQTAGTQYCEDQVGGYECQCNDDFYGTFCEVPMPCNTNANTCTGTNVCSNVDTNNDGIPEAVCKKATVCLTNADCQNGSSCVKPTASPIDNFCRCVGNFYGDVCEFENICSRGPDPCLNGSECVPQRDADNNMTENYKCVCKTGYYGGNCENTNPCILNTDNCNDSTQVCIIVEDDQFTCQDIPPSCTPNPCLNQSTCTEKTDSIECTCVNDFTGRLCEVPPACNIHDNCLNGSTCKNQPDGTHVCICIGNYFGDRCEKLPYCKQDDNERTHCNGNGICTPIVTNDEVSTTDATCTCSSGYVGSNCQHQNPCLTFDPSTCNNRGTCANVVLPDGSFHPTDIDCVCDDGWTGKFCTIEPIPDYCALPENQNKCQNGSSCRNTETGPVCDCIGVFFGDNCTQTQCQANPCVAANTISCLNISATRYQCECKNGFYGARCHLDTPFDVCTSPDHFTEAQRTCNGHGVCQDLSPSPSFPQMSCDCEDNYSGIYCETQQTVNRDCSTFTLCTNGGVCDPYGTEKQPCKCPNGFPGSYCNGEFIGGDGDNTGFSNGDSDCSVETRPVDPDTGKYPWIDKETNLPYCCIGDEVTYDRFTGNPTCVKYPYMGLWWWEWFLIGIGVLLILILLCVFANHHAVIIGFFMKLCGCGSYSPAAAAMGEQFSVNIKQD